jgi:hypothetical protein
MSFERSPCGEQRTLVSRDVHGGDFARQMLIDLHGKRIRQPQDRAWFPSPEFITRKYAKVNLERFNWITYRWEIDDIISGSSSQF